MIVHRKLHFISGKYQGGTYILSAGDAVSIGRGNDVTLTLFEEMVSRRHVEFVNGDGTVQVVDLGSKNGTFVNGERVTKAELALGDRILIGTSIVRVEEVTPEELEAVSDQGIASFADRQKAEEEAQKMTTLPSGNLPATSIVDPSLADPLEAFAFDETGLELQKVEAEPSSEEPVNLEDLAIDTSTSAEEPVMALGGSEPEIDEEPTMEPMMAAGTEDDDLGDLAAAALAALEGDGDAEDLTEMSESLDAFDDLEFEGEDELADLAAAALEVLDGGGAAVDVGTAETFVATEAETVVAAEDEAEAETVVAAEDEAEAETVVAAEDEAEAETVVAAEDEAEAETVVAAEDEAETVAETKAELEPAAAQPSEAGGGQALGAQTAIKVPIPCSAPLDLLNGRQLSLWQSAMVAGTVAGLAESMGLGVDDVLEDIKVLIDGGYVERG